MAEPKLYNTPNVLHNPAQAFAGAPAPEAPPASPSSAISEQKRMREAGIQTTKAAYVVGVEEAQRVLGLTKHARLEGLRNFLLKKLEGPKGSTLLKVPLQMGLGGLAGGILGKMHSDNFWPGALIGAGSVGLRGLAVDYVPEMRKALINKLRG